MSGQNSRTKVFAWRSVLGAAAPLVIPGTGAVISTAGAPSTVNGASGTVLTSNGPGNAPSFQSTITPRQPIGPVQFVDPANSSGFASDSNTGATSTNVPPGSGPILTTAHLSDLLFQRKLTANRMITYMSEDLFGAPLDFSTVDVGDFTLTIKMTRVVTKAAGAATINAGTAAINPQAAAGGQRQTLHTTDLANWAPYVMDTHGLGGAATVPNRIIDQVTGATAWIADGAASATASATRPVDNAVATSPAITIGHAYSIERPGQLNLALQSMPVIQGGSIVFQDCAFVIGSVGPNVTSSFTTNAIVFNHCAFLDACFIQGSFNNCALADGAQSTGILTFVAGLYLPSGADECSGILNFQGDTYVTGDTSLICSASIIESISISTGVLGIATPTGLQIQSISGTLPGLQVDPGGAPAFFGGLLWGNGNTDVGVQVTGPVGLQVPFGGAGGPVPTITGTAGDITFVYQTIGLQLARAWNNATGAYTEAGGVATRATTWANFAATIGAGGFNFQMHALETGGSIIGAE